MPTRSRARYRPPKKRLRHGIVGVDGKRLLEFGDRAEKALGAAVEQNMRIGALQPAPRVQIIRARVKRAIQIGHHQGRLKLAGNG
jgi:hypothetical protein